jgi:Na+/proline symporter
MVYFIHNFLSTMFRQAFQPSFIIIIIIIIIIFTAFEFSLGGSSPYSSTDKTNKNTLTKRYKNTVQTIQNTMRWC